jgi:hypothetical protein
MTFFLIEVTPSNLFLNLLFLGGILVLTDITLKPKTSLNNIFIIVLDKELSTIKEYLLISNNLVDLELNIGYFIKSNIKIKFNIVIDQNTKIK